MKKHDEIVMLARSKLNSIESTILKALIDNETNLENFPTTINKEINYRELKERIRMRKSQSRDIERNKLIEDNNKQTLMKLLNKSRE